MSKHIFLSIIFIVFVFTNKSFSQVECGHFTTNKNLILDSLGITRDITIIK